MASPKKASAFIPFCEDQGINYLAAAGKAGVCIQSGQIEMPAGGVVTFAALGISNMADAAYQVIIHNHTDASKMGLVALADRKVDQITIGGGAVIPTAADVLDIVVIGRVAGQTA